MNEFLASVKGNNCITNAQKRMCNNPNLDLVDINVYTKFVKFVLKILSRNENLMDRQKHRQAE